jgi:hypothetical protein
MKSRLVDDVIKSSISPVFRTEGFAKKGRTWNRRQHDLVQAVDVQEARYGDERNTSFTLNLGICAPKAYSICWGRTSPALVKVHDCQLIKRVGELLSLSTKGAIDYWWKLGIDAGPMGDEVAAVIKGRVLPYMSSINSLESLRRELGHQTSFRRHEVWTFIHLTIITAMLGDVNAAQQELQRIRAAHTGWSERIDVVMENIRNLNNERLT